MTTIWIATEIKEQSVLASYLTSYTATKVHMTH